MVFTRRVKSGFINTITNVEKSGKVAHNMFIGTYYHRIEEKNRVSLPKKFRSMGDSWVITHGLDGGVFLFLAEDFQAELQKLSQLAFTKKAHRDFIRLMANEASEVEVDQSGRILLPEFLRASAQLVKDVAIVGSYQRIEIWNVEKYHQYLDHLNSNAEGIAEEVSL